MSSSYATRRYASISCTATMMASRAHRLARRLSSAAASYDALVIGGGSAGTEIARLGLIGLNVAVVDPRELWKLTIINHKVM